MLVEEALVMGTAGEVGSRRRLVIPPRNVKIVVSVLCFLMALAGPLSASGEEQLETVPPYGLAPVGYTTMVVEGDSDDITPTTGDSRRLLVEIWFPAQQKGSQPKHWASDKVGDALSGQFPFPEGFHSRISTHSWLDVRPVDAEMPAIIFSHGLSFPPTLYQSLFEDLASRGFAVFAVSHPHGASIIEYPDGTTLDMSLWPGIEDEAARQQMLARAAERWAADLSAVLSSIASGRVPSGIVVDKSRLGLAGHSLGGTAVGKLTDDPRISAVAVMEGDVRNVGDEHSRGSLRVSAPLLHLIGGYNRLELERPSYLPSRSAPVITAVVRGTGHAYFSDLIHFYRAFADRDFHERHRYELDPDRVLRITSDYLSAFFDWQLNGSEPGLLLRRAGYSARVEGPMQGGYPEVDLTILID